MKRISIPVLVAALLFQVACGGEKADNSLAGKQKKLKELQSQLQKLNGEISAIEADIAKLDPNAAAKAKQMLVTVKDLAPQTMTHFIKAQGTVSSNRNVMVGAQAPGKITAIYVKEGQFVNEGTLLAKVDDAILRKSREQLQTAYNLAKTMYTKQKALWDKQIGTEIQYLQAETQMKSLEQQLAALDTQIEMYEIKAPIAGTVDMVNSKVGEMASPGFPSFKIVNKTDLVIKAEFAESFIPYVKKGDAVKVVFPAIGKDFAARVSRIGEEVNPMNRTFTVEIDLPQSTMLKPNMIGEVSVNDQNKSSAIVVPINAVQKGETSDYVYVAINQGGKTVASRRNVTLGLSQGDNVEVASGLQSGDRLITSGIMDLSEGQEVSF